MPHLLFLMTPGNGLAAWERLGSIRRELAPYREYVKRGWEVTIGTFRDGMGVPGEADGLRLASCPRGRLLFVLPWSSLREAACRADLIKTNQSANSWWYVWAARVWGKPILLRCGYVAGAMLEAVEGRTIRVRWYQAWEAWAFRSATHCAVTTESSKSWVCSRYGVDSERVTVVPNFIDASLFKPLPPLPKERRSVVYTGHLSAVKNVALLVRACARADASTLTLVGSGPEEDAIRDLSAQLRLRLIVAGRVRNEALPELLQRNEVYAQTSLFEGHPKALIEAQACGMPCVGCRVTGVEDVITDELTGLLAEPTVESVASALARLFEDGALRAELAAAATEEAHRRYAFETVFERELALATSLVKPWVARR